MKNSLALVLILFLSLAAEAQKKVAAVANLTVSQSGSVTILKGKLFVVQLPVHNRTGDDWAFAKPPIKCNFTEAMLGEAGMLPNQPEPKLMFFKAVEKGVDSIRFVYKNPKAAAGTVPEEKLLKVVVE